MISSIVISFLPDVKFSKIFFAPRISALFSKGESSVSSIASNALFSPEALPEAIIDTPLSCITVRTSSKSTLITPFTVIISAIPFAAIVNTSSAFANASVIFRFPNFSRNVSLFIISIESTFWLRASMPFNAYSYRFLPSNSKGIVTIPTVSTPKFLEISAITGAAPVPVPPPIPAVINTICVSSESSFSNSAVLSFAAFSPTSGLLPAPRPPVKPSPICTLTGTGLF